MSSLEIPCPRDVAVKKYGEWQMSNVENDTLKGKKSSYIEEVTFHVQPR
jgi:hypothetical protein